MGSKDMEDVEYPNIGRLSREMGPALWWLPLICKYDDVYVLIDRSFCNPVRVRLTRG